ncbi:LuxR C-terminal-related transcriptional regulator [Cellulomonas sp. ACRRI]|uniref:helix-turn-helix transcriptional regulator n=1 Tax=Cellulomonas sp. ACRRI TaxID=2918188 RepID=UPI001EF18591|nr:LuxR C-terminal-related transcriptional regulator [Cellulomonas sp. ACRRI]MCG7288206.1 LuxR C-terminal-related transcriptional regulator [Cellulomonas sp. ACRRI]
MSAGGRDEALPAVRRWLAAGRDVVLRGERGMGKSTTLEALRADLSDRRLPGVLLRASGPAPFAAVLDHPSAPAQVPDENALTAWLADELAAPRSVLLVDDVDRLDPGSLRVVQRALVRTGCRVVAASTADLLRTARGGPRELLVARAPAEVVVPPLGLPALSVLVASTLGGPADAALTGTLLAQSGGNPGAAVALLAAARATGALRREEGRHVDDGRLLEVPADAVAALFLGDLDGARVDALQRLAVVGPVTADAAARLVDPPLLDGLADQGRLVEHEASGDDAVLVVAPPALARALRDRVAPPHRRRLLAAARAVVGDVVAVVEPPRPDLTALLARDAAGSADFLRWSSQVAGVVQERAAAAESAAQAAWAADPRHGTATAYLAQLMRRPARDQIAAVFRETARSPEDSEDDVVAFRYYRTRWEAWRGGDDPDGRPDPAGDGLGRLAELEDLKQQLVAAIRDGEPAEAVAAAEPPTVAAAAFRGGPELLRAAALLEAGRPDLALTVLDRADDADDDAAPVSTEVRHYRAALRGECLGLLGRLDAAERHERLLLSAAYDAYDAFGIRVHAAVLAEVLCFTGEIEAAWRVLSTALRLGPAGPIETTFYRRGLALGAVLQVGAGNVDLARALLRELEKTPKIYRPLIRSLRVVGGIAVAVADGDRATGAEIAWRAGLSYAEAGLRQPALVTWAFAPPPLTPERAARVRATRQDVVLPLLDPYLDLQLALADRDEAAAAAALPAVQPRVSVALTAAARDLLGLDDAAPADRAAAPAREPLSDREREVAALGREGLSNRQIAERLHLSVRTVENHMSRALRKLGYRARGDLTRWTVG